MFDCQNALLRVTVLAADLIRVRMQPERSFGPNESWAVVTTVWPAVPLQVSESRSSVRLTTPELVIKIGRQPCRMVIRDSRGEVINEDAPGRE